MRTVALLSVVVVLCGCGPRPLPPILEVPLLVTNASKCHGLDTAFEWQATHVGGDKSDEYHRLRWGYNFLYMFGFAGHRDLKQVPSFAKAVLEPGNSTLRLVFLDAKGSTLAESKIRS